MKSARLWPFLMTVGVFVAAPAFATAQETPPPICRITANSGFVLKGGTVNLRWESTNATGGTITSIGEVGPSGVQGVIPTQTTEYVGIFTGAGGYARCSVLVHVILPGGEVTPLAPLTLPGGQIMDPSPRAQPAVESQPNPYLQGQNPAVQSPTISPSPQVQRPVVQQGLVPCTGLNCQACHLAELAQRFINFLILLTAPLAAILIAAAGAMYFTSGVVNKKEQAKKILRAGVVGFLVAISAWVVINTLLNVLVDPSFKQGGSWFNIQCITDVSARRGSTPGNSTDVKSWLDAILGQSQALPIAPSPTAPVDAEGVPAGYVRVEAFACKNENSCAVSPTTNLLLEQARMALGERASQYQITETGINTTVTHASGVDNLDVSCFGVCSPAQINAMISAWPGTVRYETNEQADYDAKLSAGVPAANLILLKGKFDSLGNCTAGPGKCITAPHMSLETKRQIR